MTNTPKLDSTNIYGSLQNFPDQFTAGFAWSSHIRLAHQYQRVVIAGMGGSANFVDLINCLFIEQLPQPIRICRNYTLPTNWLGDDTLIILCSFSGNTEETLSVYQQAKQSGSHIVVVTSGGQLADLAQADNLPLVKLEKPSIGFQPRIGLGFFFASIINILHAASWLTTSALENFTKSLSAVDRASAHDLGKRLASNINQLTPVIYAPDHLWPIARIGKININENGKVPAFWNCLPEANHNEMMGFLNHGASYIVILLLDPSDHPQNIKRFRVTEHIYRDLGITTNTITMVGNNLIERSIHALLLTMWASYYLAIQNNIDPAPVPLVEEFKTQLSS